MPDRKKIISKFFIFIFIMLFVTVFTLIFSEANSYIAVAMITGIMMFKFTDLYIPYQKSPFVITGLFLLIGFSAWASKFNPFLGFFINFFTMVIFLTLSSAHMDSKTYMPFILCYIFIQANPVPDKAMPLRILALLVGGLLVSFTYAFYHRTSTHKHKVHKMFKLLHPDTLHFQFIMRLALGESIAMFLGDYFHIPRYMWIALTIMSLTQPFYARTQERMKYRLFGTVLGAIIFSFIFKGLIPPQYLTISFLILNFIYTFITDYKIQMIFVTMTSLNAAVVLFGTDTSVILRIIMICSGIVIAYFINHANVYASHHYFLHKIRKEEAQNHSDDT